MSEGIDVIQLAVTSRRLPFQIAFLCSWESLKLNAEKQAICNPCWQDLYPALVARPFFRSWSQLLAPGTKRP